MRLGAGVYTCTYRVTNPSGLIQYVLETTDLARGLRVRASG